MSFIHLVVCLTTGSKPPPKRAVHIVRSRASSFKWEYPLLSLRSSNSFLRLLPCLHVTSIPPCIFPSVTRCRRQFLRKMWPIQFAFRLRISCRIFLCSLTLSSKSSFLTWSVQLIFSILLQHHISKLSRCFWSKYSPLCRRCGVMEETSTHILCECESLASLRHAYLGFFFLEPKDIQRISLGAIWSFSNDSRLPLLDRGHKRAGL